jgi:hypothetical protein
MALEADGTQHTAMVLVDFGAENVIGAVKTVYTKSEIDQSSMLSSQPTPRSALLPALGAGSRWPPCTRR